MIDRVDSPEKTRYNIPNRLDIWSNAVRPDFQPRYYKIMEKLKEQIHNGTYSPGEQLPSQNVLMKQENASYSTISRVLNELKSDGYIYRINGKGTFVSEDRKPGNRDFTIKIVYHESSNLLQQDEEATYERAMLQHGISGRAYELGCKVEPVYFNDASGFTTGNFDQETDGVIFLNDTGKERLFKTLEAKKIPYITHAAARPECFSVNRLIVDVREGAYRAVKALLDSGRKRIALFHTKREPNAWSDPKCEGYRDALREAGIEFSEKMIIRSHQTYDGLGKAMECFLDSPAGKTIDALFAINDFRAIGAMQFLLKKGLKIPDDVAVAGYDNNPRAKECTPTLTTMNYPRGEIGRSMVEMLLLLRENPEIAPFTKVFISEMIVRKSFIP